MRRLSTKRQRGACAVTQFVNLIRAYLGRPRETPGRCKQYGLAYIHLFLERIGLSSMFCRWRGGGAVGQIGVWLRSTPRVGPYVHGHASIDSSRMWHGGHLVCPNLQVLLRVSVADIRMF